MGKPIREFWYKAVAKEDETPSQVSHTHTHTHIYIYIYMPSFLIRSENAARFLAVI